MNPNDEPRLKIKLSYRSQRGAWHAVETNKDVWMTAEEAVKYAREFIERMQSYIDWERERNEPE